jgi:hypothetical protein
MAFRSIKKAASVNWIGLAVMGEELNSNGLRRS